MSTGERKAKLLDNNKDAKTSSLAITHSNNSDEITVRNLCVLIVVIIKINILLLNITY